MLVSLQDIKRNIVKVIKKARNTISIPAIRTVPLRIVRSLKVIGAQAQKTESESVVISC